LVVFVIVRPLYRCLWARLARKRLSKFVQRLTRLSNQTRPLSNLRCQRLDSQLSAIGRRFVG